MYLFYIFACIPLIIGCVLWIKDPHISLVEWLAGSAAAFIVAGIMHLIAVKGMTHDTEMWSGYVTSTRQFSAWKEYYEYAVYRTEYYWTTETYTTTDGKGHTSYHTRMVQKSRQVFDHWEPTSRWHQAYWETYDTLQKTISIDVVKFDDLCQKYGNKQAIAGARQTGEHNSTMIEGDPNDYIAGWNGTNWIEPVYTTKSFENRIKAAPSVFSFIKVPTNVPVFDWPKTGPNPFQSNRLLGRAVTDFSILKLDQMNAVLGSAKKVNVIIVGFDSDDTMLAEYQKAKWVGGKKNDLVICYGPRWSRVFGWTDSELAKENIQTFFLEYKKNDELLPMVEQEIKDNYTIKDWHRFDYIAIEPRAAHFIWFFAILLITQIALYWFFHTNQLDKEVELEMIAAGIVPVRKFADDVHEAASSLWKECALIVVHLPKDLMETFRKW